MNGPGATARRSWVPLAAVLALGLAVRLWGVTFGLPLVTARPDEVMLLNIAVKMHGGDPNPHFFDYPSLYLYLLAGLYAVYYWWGLVRGEVSGPAEFILSFREHYEPFFLIARTATALMGTATIAVVHAIGTALFDRTAGMTASLFLALAFLHVRDSHFGTTDVPMTFFIMCTMLALVRLHRSRASRDAWLAGVLGGCAAGMKYNAVMLAVPMIVVEVLHAFRNRNSWRRIVRETHLVRLGIAFAAVFVATSPYLILDYETALRDLRLLQQSTASGMTPRDVLGRGWWYHLPFSLRHGVGAPLLTAGLGGFLWMAWRTPSLALILGSFPIAYYAAAGAGYNVFVRYMIPIVPFLCIFAGDAVARIAAAVQRRMPVPAPVAAAALALAIVAPSAWSVVRFDTIIAAEDSRLVAGRWIHDNVPAGNTICLVGNYGLLQLERPPAPEKYKYMSYDRARERFTVARQPADTLPDWIVVQRSALPYSDVSPVLQRLVEAEYHLVQTVRAANLAETGNAYDIQDAFYAPYAGFKGVRRPGPNLEIYQRNR